MEATFTPMAFPRSDGGNTDVSIAIPMVRTREPPIPCTALSAMKKGMEGAKGQQNVERMKTRSPAERILFLPHMSPILPAGTRNTAEERR